MERTVPHSTESASEMFQHDSHSLCSTQAELWTISILGFCFGYSDWEQMQPRYAAMVALKYKKWLDKSVWRLAVTTELICGGRWPFKLPQQPVNLQTSKPVKKDLTDPTVPMLGSCSDKPLLEKESTVGSHDMGSLASSKSFCSKPSH